MAENKIIRVHSVGTSAGKVNLWVEPMWLKRPTDELVKGEMTPGQAREIAIKLLQAAEMAGGGHL